MEHFYEALTDGGASAVLAASLFHFGELSLSELKNYLRSRGVVVR
jgi:cyclase